MNFSLGCKHMLHTMRTLPARPAQMFPLGMLAACFEYDGSLKQRKQEPAPFQLSTIWKPGTSSCMHTCGLGCMTTESHDRVHERFLQGAGRIRGHGARRWGVFCRRRGSPSQGEGRCSGFRVQNSRELALRRRDTLTNLKKSPGDSDPRRRRKSPYGSATAHRASGTLRA